MKNLKGLLPVQKEHTRTYGNKTVVINKGNDKCGHNKHNKKTESNSALFDDVNKEFAKENIQSMIINSIQSKYSNMINTIFSNIDKSKFHVETVINENPQEEINSILADYPELEELTLPISGHSQEFYDGQPLVTRELVIGSAVSVDNQGEDLYEVSSYLNKVNEKIESYLEALPESKESKESVKTLSEVLGKGFTRIELEYYLARNSKNQNTLRQLFSCSAVVRLGLVGNDDLGIQELEVLACDSNPMVRLNAKEVISLRGGK